MSSDMAQKADDQIEGGICERDRLYGELENLKIQNDILRGRVRSLEAENQGYWDKTKALCNNIKILGGKLQISELKARVRGDSLAAAQRKLSELLKDKENSAT